MKTSDKAVKDIEIVLDNYSFNLDKVFLEDTLTKIHLDNLALLRNSIYAKHKCIFSEKEYHDYFSQFDWYSAKYKDVSKRLTDVDMSNIEAVKNVENEINSLKYTSKTHKFSISFPLNWKDKYIIKEDTTGVYAFFKPSSTYNFDYGELFSITLNDDLLDAIWQVEPKVTINNKEYFIGGPTGVAISLDHPEADVFLKMNKERADVLKTIKEIESE